MELERKNFIYGKVDENENIIVPGAIRNGVDEKSATKIYDLMIDFANYAFNKSHSAAYAVVAYRTGWLKHYYPVEFMAAQISSQMGSTASVSLYIQECKRLGIQMLPPDINKSFSKFTAHGNEIRFGLTAVKNVGENFIKAIVIARKDGLFTGFVDFIERIEAVDSSAMNKRAVESLIKCGALDSLGDNRTQYLAVFEKTIDGIHADRKRNLEGQYSLFDRVEDSTKVDNLPDLKEFPQKTLLAMEKEMLGIYVSGHPLEPYDRELKRVSNISTVELIQELNDTNEGLGPRDGDRVTIGGIIVEKKNKITKNNNMMAFITLEDLYGSVECIVFPQTYDRFNEFLFEDGFVVIDGRLSMSEVEEPKIICEKIRELKQYKMDKIYLKIPKNKDINVFEQIKPILKEHTGDIPVYVYLESEKRMIVADRSLWISAENEQLILKLEELLGKESIKLS